MQSAAPPKSLVQAMRRVMLPIARIMLAKGITYPFLAEMLKGVFVEVAERDFRLDDKPQTDSRISLLSGVHRKDVRRLREQPERDETQPQAVSLGSQLVAAWTGLPQYLDAEGRPLPLPRLARNSDDISFEGLVAGVSKDIRSRAVLDEWLRLGVAHLDDEDRVLLNAAAFVPAKGFDEKVFYFGHNVHDHAAAAVHNVIGEGIPFLERSVHYEALTAESIAQLRQLAERAGMQAALSVNRRALELEKRDANAAGPRHRMTFGIYFYSAAAAGAPDQPHA